MDNQDVWILLGKKLAGEASPEDISALQDLLKNHPDAQYMLELLSATWEQRKMSKGSDNTELLFSRHIKRLAQAGYDMTTMPEKETKQAEHIIYPWEQTAKRNKALKILLAASVILLLTGGLLFYFLPFNQSKATAVKKIASTLNEVSTKYGSRSQITLPDGTHVWLNSGSKLTYDNDFANKPKREVTLSGEAFFDVTHRGGQPFIIHTSRLDIKVLGTAFNVRSYPEDETMETTLLRGSIEISFHENPARKIILKPNEKIVVFNDQYALSNIDSAHNQTAEKKEKNEELFAISHIHREIKDSSIIETSWMNNKLIFEQETFIDLARQMERWYNVSFHFSTDKLMEYRFTGIFTNESIDQALHALQLTSPSSPFRYRIDKQDVFIYKK